MLFSRWGAFAYRFRRPIVLVTVLFAIASAVIGARVTSALSAGGWVDPTSESFAVSARLNDEFGAGRGTLIVLYQGEPGSDARSAAVQGAIATANPEKATALPLVATVVSTAWATVRPRRSSSRKRLTMNSE